MTLPNSELLNQIQQYILTRPNKPEESKKSVHCGLFLLCSESGLRISEALNFDLTKKTSQGLYKISPTKKQAERYVYIPAKVVNELKKQSWKPNQTNRFNFYHFLKRVKAELNVPSQVELTPHTLRRCFATYQAQAGMPLPLLSKMLGHKSIRTTALYWMNIYESEPSIKPPNDIADVLLGKEWIEKQEEKPPSQPQPEPLIISQPESVLAVSLPENTAPNIAKNFSLEVSEAEPSKVQSLDNGLEAEKEASPIEPKPQEKSTPILAEISAEKTSEQGKVSELLESVISEPNPEQVLLNKIQQLEGELKQVKTERDQAKARANYYEQQLKTIAQSLCQWAKINYYQQQEQAEQKAQIVQAERPPPFRSGK